MGLLFSQEPFSCESKLVKPYTLCHSWTCREARASPAERFPLEVGSLFFLLLARERGIVPRGQGQSHRKEVSRVRDYELIFIVAPAVEDEKVRDVVDKVRGWIKAGGGEVTKVDLWGRRKLAYPIQRFSEGTYVFLNVRLKPTALDELERNIKLDTSIIRYLLVRVGE